MKNSKPPHDDAPGLFDELRRRRVFRVAGTYVLVAWVLMQAGEIVFPAFELPNRALRLLILCLVAGFPVAIFLAWLFDVSSSGLRLTPAADSRDAEDAPHASRGLEILLLGLALPVFASATLLIIFTLQPQDDSESRAIEGIRAPDIASSRDLAASPGLAVLPFVDLSAENAEETYFARGIHEEVLTHLARIPGLRLISQHSIEAQADASLSAFEIARRLGVDHLLEGSVRRSATRVRVSAKLIVPESGEQLWADSFDGELARSLEVQSELARRIASALEIELAPATPQPRRTAATTLPSLPALDAYLEARELHRQSSATDSASLHRAQILYEEALRLEPEFARAWLHLGVLHAELYWFGFDESASRAVRARGCLDQARDRGAAPDQLALADGIIAYYVDGEYDRALLFFDEVARHAPSNAEAEFYRGMILRRSSAFDLALEAQRRARLLDPLNAGFEDEYALTLALAGRMKESISVLSEILARDPDRDGAFMRRSLLELEVERDPDAVVNDMLASEALRWSQPRQSLLAHAAILAGRAEEAYETLERLPPNPTGHGAHEETLSRLSDAMGNAGLARGWAENADASLRATTRRSPAPVQDDSIRQLRAWIDFRLGRREEALESQRTLVSEHPIEVDLIVGAPILWDLVIMQLEADRPEAAARSFDRLASFVAPGSIPYAGYLVLDRSPTLSEATRHSSFQAALERHRPAYARTRAR